VKTVQRMDAGIQDGKDVHVIFLDENNEYSWYFEAKNFDNKVGPNDVLGKLIQNETQYPDAFIIVSPKTPVSNNVQSKIEEQNANRICKISKWTSTEDVHELFSLNPLIYEKIYGYKPDIEITSRRGEIFAKWKQIIDVDCKEILRRRNLKEEPILETNFSKGIDSLRKSATHSPSGRAQIARLSARMSHLVIDLYIRNKGTAPARIVEVKISTKTPGIRLLSDVEFNSLRLDDGLTYNNLQEAELVNAYIARMQGLRYEPEIEPSYDFEIIKHNTEIFLDHLHIFFARTYNAKEIILDINYSSSDRGLRPEEHLLIQTEW